jgi:hypothetical protein
MRRDSSVDIVMGYKLVGWGSVPCRIKRIFFFSAVSKSALEPTQSPGHQVPGTISLGAKNGGTYLHSPIHGA